MLRTFIIGSRQKAVLAVCYVPYPRNPRDLHGAKRPSTQWFAVWYPANCLEGRRDRNLVSVLCYSANFVSSDGGRWSCWKKVLETAEVRMERSDHPRSDCPRLSESVHAKARSYPAKIHSKPSGCSLANCPSLIHKFRKLFFYFILELRVCLRGFAERRRVRRRVRRIPAAGARSKIRISYTLCSVPAWQWSALTMLTCRLWSPMPGLCCTTLKDASFASLLSVLINSYRLVSIELLRSASVIICARGIVKLPASWRRKYGWSMWTSLMYGAPSSCSLHSK